MASPHLWFNKPLFDLGISDDSVVEDSLENNTDPDNENSVEFEDLSLLIVEDSLDKDGAGGAVQNELFIGEDISQRDDAVKAKEIESSNGIEGGKSAGKFKHHFDLNKVPDEALSMENVCADFEESMKTGEVRNLRRKVVQPYERAFLDLNRGDYDLNKFPDEGLDFGLKSEELNKGVHEMLKIYLGSLY